MVKPHTTTLAAVLGVFFVERALAALDVGDDHVCATVGSTLKCWGALSGTPHSVPTRKGYNGYGQLGRGDTEDIGDAPGEMGYELVAFDAGSGELVADVALGSMFSCAVLESNTVKCFGKNDKGQLGQGDTFTRGDEPGELGDALPPIDFGESNPRSITAGCEHVCALLDDGSVKCFGDNAYGQLGQGHTDNIGDELGEMGSNLTAVEIGSSAKAVSAGCHFTCALTEDGTVMCWGRNDHGQLGIGAEGNVLDKASDVLAGVDLDGEAVHSIGAGGMHVCVRLENADVKCWGRNNNGQLGYGDERDRGLLPSDMGANLEAVDVGAGSSPEALDSGYLHTCILMDDGSIKCFGDNEHGELGIGSIIDVGNDPYDMGANLTVVDLGGDASKVAAGGHTTCARLVGGGVKCWGEANHGQLGQGSMQEIGIIPGDLANLPVIDLGPALFTAAPSAAPSAVPTSAETVEPSISPGATIGPSMPSSTPAPLAQGETRAPSMPAAVNGSAAPTTSDMSGGGTAGSPGVMFLATGVAFIAALVTLG